MTDKLVKTDDELVNRLEGELTYGDSLEEMAARRRAIARLQLLWDRRRPLLKLLIGGFAASLIVACVIPHRYESTVRLMPPDPQTGTGIAALASLAGEPAGAGALAGLAGDFLGSKSSGDLFVGVLGSRTVQDALITKFDLKKIYGKRLLLDTRKMLAHRTDVTQEKKSGIITIVVTDRSPERAAEMALEYVNQLDWVMTQLSTSSAHRERVLLEGRLQQVQLDLEAAEKNFSEFASKNVALDIPEQGKAMVEAASALEGQLIAAQTELQGLKEIYTDNNVRVRSTQARIDELQRQVQKLSGEAGSSDKNANVTTDASYPSIRKLPLLGVTYADLLRNTKVQEAIYEVLTQEYEIAKVTEAKEIPSVKVLDPPDIPEKKSFPPRILITLLGSVFAFAGGIVWILGSDHWNRTDPHDPAKSLATRIYADVLEGLPWPSRNGSAAGAFRSWLPTSSNGGSSLDKTPGEEP